MAHRKAGGTAKNLRDSGPKFLGVKVASGESVRPGMIIVRQRGTPILPGAGTLLGRDHTIMALVAGKVKFSSKRKVGYNGQTKKLPIVSVEIV